jgi:hypothetical protein
MGFLLWCFAILSALINLVVLTPKKWRVFFWALLPLGDLHGASKVFEEQTLTTAQKRKQTAEAKKLEAKVQLEGLVLLKKISDDIGVEHPSVTHTGVIILARNQLSKGSRELKKYLELDEEYTATPTSTPLQTNAPRTATSVVSGVTRAPSTGGSSTGHGRRPSRSKSPRRIADEKQLPAGGLMQSIMNSPLLARLSARRGGMGYDGDEE